MGQETLGSEEKGSDQETLRTQSGRLGPAWGQGSCPEEVTVQLSLEGVDQAESYSAHLRTWTWESLYPGPHVCQTLSLGSGSGTPLPRAPSSLLLTVAVAMSPTILYSGPKQTITQGSGDSCREHTFLPSNGCMRDWWQGGWGWRI